MWKKAPSHYKNISVTNPSAENQESSSGTSSSGLEGFQPEPSLFNENNVTGIISSNKRKIDEISAIENETVREIEIPEDDYSLVIESVDPPQYEPPAIVMEVQQAPQQLPIVFETVPDVEKTKAPRNYKFKTLDCFKSKDDFWEHLMGHPYCNKYSCYHNAVHQCSIHMEPDGSACQHQFRICERNDEKGEKIYELQERGEHSNILKQDNERGVHPLMIIDIDEMLMSGVTPSQIIRILKNKYETRPDILSLIPKKTKIVSRKITAKVKGPQKRNPLFVYHPPMSNVTYSYEQMKEIWERVKNKANQEAGGATDSGSGSVYENSSNQQVDVIDAASGPMITTVPQDNTLYDAVHGHSLFSADSTTSLHSMSVNNGNSNGNGNGNSHVGFHGSHDHLQQNYAITHNGHNSDFVAHLGGTENDSSSDDSDDEGGLLRYAAVGSSSGSSMPAQQSAAVVASTALSNPSNPSVDVTEEPSREPVSLATESVQV